MKTYERMVVIVRPQPSSKTEFTLAMRKPDGSWVDFDADYKNWRVVGVVPDSEATIRSIEEFHHSWGKSPEFSAAFCVMLERESNNE